MCYTGWVYHKVCVIVHRYVLYWVGVSEPYIIQDRCTRTFSLYIQGVCVAQSPWHSIPLTLVYIRWVHQKSCVIYGRLSEPWNTARVYQSSVKYGAGVLEICEIRRGCIRTLFYTRWVYQNSVLYKVGVSEICVIQRGYIKLWVTERGCMKTLCYTAGCVRNLCYFGRVCHRVCAILDCSVTHQTVSLGTGTLRTLH